MPCLRWHPTSAWSLVSVLVLVAASSMSAASVVADDDMDAARVGSGSNVVRTHDGPVKGSPTSSVRTFLGIPYAAPPVGALRWRPPEPHAKWTVPLDASAFGHHCPQPEAPAAQAHASEDCLFLNVFAPRASNSERNSERELEEGRDQRPVMVWIHGGSLVTGKSDDFDPTQLVELGDVVVVTINYRLGALGFLVHPALDAEGHRFANYGLMDQQRALEWVHRNIAAFGGDPDNVTIFGESAGGQSVTSHLHAPDSAGLFQRAIIESGAYALTLPTTATAEAQGSAFATRVGCADQTATCLRSASVATLVRNEATLYITTQDGQVLLQSPMAAFASGQFNRVPVMQGSNHDEYRLFVALRFDLAGGPLTASAYPAALAAQSRIGPNNAPTVVSEYPLSNYPSPDLAYATAVGDQLFSCSARASNQLLARWVPTFAYEFNDLNAPSFLPRVSFPYGATHAFELAYLFDLSFLAAPHFSADQRVLASTMKRYWARFAHEANPSSFETPFWPRYDPQVDGIQSLVPPTPGVEFDFASQHHCAFWHALLPAWD